MLQKSGTCPHCDYPKSDCHCGRKINTSGDYVAYNNYTDYRNTADYAMTARINRTSSEDRKIMEELLPVNGETVFNFLKRSDIAEQKLIEYSLQHHLYGTKRVWSCHTSSRYCFICNLSQYLNMLRAMYNGLSDLIDLKNYYFHVTKNNDGYPSIKIISSQ